MRPMSEGLGYQSEWMEGVNAMTFLLYPAFALPLIEIIIPIIIENLEIYTTKVAIEKAAQYGIGMSIDAFMQALINYYFEQEGDTKDWAQAWESINWVEANLSGMESLITNPLISHASSCLRSGILEDGKLREGFDTQSCFTGTLTSIMGDMVFKSLKGAYKKIQQIAKEKPEKLVYVLSTMDIADDDIVKVINEQTLLPFDQEIVSSVRQVEANFNAAAEAVEQGVANDATNCLSLIDGKLSAEPIWMRNDQRFRQRRVEMAEGKAPKTKEWNEQTISTNPLPNKVKDDICGQLSNTLGVTDIRVNQTQSDALGNALGLNRPDIQFTYNNKRYYIEIEAPGSNRGPAHKKRITNNDPVAGSADPLPDELKGVSVTINGKQYTLTGTITIIEY